MSEENSGCHHKQHKKSKLRCQKIDQTVKIPKNRIVFQYIYFDQKKRTLFKDLVSDNEKVFLHKWFYAASQSITFSFQKSPTVKIMSL